MPARVLIVDDHPSFRASARALLEADGYVVVGEAQDGETALQAALELAPDIVLLDVQLPGMSGFQVAERMRARGTTAAIVLTSSRDACDFGALPTLAGARGFIAKGELSGPGIAALAA
jgi:DNA-binding NarL/FixJ family response regulator